MDTVFLHYTYQANDSSTIANNTDIYATVVGEGASTSSLGYQFKVGGSNVDPLRSEKLLSRRRPPAAQNSRLTYTGWKAPDMLWPMSKLAI